jgi:FkbM family methyltransferase
MLNKVIYHLKVIKSQTIADPVNNGYKMKLASDYIQWLLFYKHKNRDWLIKFDNGYKSTVKPYPDHDSGSMNIWTRNVDYLEIEFIRKQLQKGDWIIDGGCNVGNRTWAMADLLGGAILVDANPKAIARTKENLRLNRLPEDKYILVENALGDKPGVIRFSDRGGARTDNRILPEGEEEGSVSMEMTTIDLLVSAYKIRPAFIKLDVEGYDYFALKGAEQTLRSGAVKLVKFEILDFSTFGQFKEFFSSIGWRLFALTEKGQPVADEGFFEKQLNLFAAPAAVCAKYL